MKSTQLTYNQQTHAGSCRLARILESDNGWILDCVPKEIAPTAFQTSYVLGPDSGTVVALRRWESAGIKQAPYRKDMAADLIVRHIGFKDASKTDNAVVHSYCRGSSG